MYGTAYSLKFTSAPWVLGLRGSFFKIKDPTRSKIRVFLAGIVIIGRMISEGLKKRRQQ